VRALRQSTAGNTVVIKESLIAIFAAVMNSNLMTERFPSFLPRQKKSDLLGGVIISISISSRDPAYLLLKTPLLTPKLSNGAKSTLHPCDPTVQYAMCDP
jgi:hypothetical protein